MAHDHLSELRGLIIMFATAEHHTLYQYNLVGAKEHYMGLIQTETVRAVLQSEPSGFG